MITEILPHAHAVILASAEHPLRLAAPNPPAVPIPGLDSPGGPLYTIIGWAKWLMFFLGFLGLLMCAAQMAIGRRNRHSMAADGASGIPWVLGALALTAIASGVVGVFITP
jgi:hypothetical protein